MNMHFHSATITSVTKESDDVYTVHIQPVDPYNFISGQYCALRLPTDEALAPVHYFSIASSQETTGPIEFSIRTYGEWTSSLVKHAVGSSLEISDPMGSFVLPEAHVPLVYLVGGVGIVPVISMLRHLSAQSWEHPITLLYGNRTPETILYKSELEKLQQRLTSLKIIHILSEKPLSDNEHTYRGFITESILACEVDFSGNPLFYLNGPTIFLEKMKILLQKFGISEKHIITES